MYFTKFFSLTKRLVLLSVGTDRPKKNAHEIFANPKKSGFNEKKIFFSPAEKIFFFDVSISTKYCRVQKAKIFFLGVHFFFGPKKFFFSGHFCLCRKVPLRCPGKKISPIGTALPTTNFLPYDSQISGTSWGGMKCLLQNFSLL